MNDDIDPFDDDRPSVFEQAAQEWWRERNQERKQVRRPPQAVTPYKPAPSLQVVDPLSWHGQDVPPRQWIVPDWVPYGFATSLYGDAGLGKTLLAQQLMTACATGQPWCGLPVNHCASIGLFCEDYEDELHRRQDAINRAMGLDYGDLGDMRLIPSVAGDNLLMTFDPDGRGVTTPLYAELIDQAARIGAALVVIDGLGTTFAGNENIRPQATQYVAALHRMAQAIGGAVLLIAHPSVDGLRSGSGYSGSTAWNATVRSRLYLSRPPEGEEGGERHGTGRLLSREKANYAATGDQVRLDWKDGALVATEAPPAASGAVGRISAEKAFLDCLAALESQSRSVSDSYRSDRYAPNVMRRMPPAKGHTAGDLARAMERLFDSGRIQIATDGPPSKQVRRIVVVPPDDGASE